MQDSSKTGDGKDDVLSAEFDNDTIQLTHNESQGTDVVTVLIEEQKRDETLTPCWVWLVKVKAIL